MSVVTEMKDIAKGGILQRLNMDQIHFHVDNNIRAANSYDPESMGEMEASIEAVGGILQPVLVTEVEPGPTSDNKPYVLLAGYRRMMALQSLAADDPKYGQEIPVVIVETKSAAGFKLSQLIENVQRKDLRPLEQAMAMDAAMSDPDTKLTQADVAEITGISTAKVSKILALLKFKDYPTILKMAEPTVDEEGKLQEPKLSFSHLYLIASSVPPENWMDVAKIGATMTYPAFYNRIKGEFIDATTGDEVAGEGAATDGTQRPRQSKRAPDIEKIYLPYFKQRIDGAKDDREKTLWIARTDAIRWVQNMDGTQLGEDLKAYEADLEAKKKKAEDDKKSESSHKAFIKEELALFRKLLAAPVEEGQVRPTKAQNWAVVRQDVEKKLKADNWKERGFDIKDVGAFMEELTQQYLKDEETRKAAKETKRLAAEKKKKEEEEAAKKAGTPAGSVA